MAIKTSFDEESRTWVIEIQKDFTFLLLAQFQAAYQEGAPQDHYIVKFTGAGYIDSSGLGMLLMLRQHAGGSTARITLSDLNEEILRVLRIANFDQLFTIDP